MLEINEFISKNEKTLILCKSHTCNVCLAIEDKLKKIQEGIKGWNMANIYIDDIPLFRGQNNVYTAPTVIIFYENKEIYRTSRFVEIDKIKYYINVYNKFT